MKKNYDAFISYGRADSKAFAIELQNRLSKQGFRVWFDFNDIPLAVDFQNQIDDGIEKSHNFMFVISPHSVNSPYCLKEIQLAIELNKRIIPLLHVMEISREIWQQRNANGTQSEWEAYKGKGLHESYQNMHPTIRKLNWVYFQEGINDYEKSLANLIAVLRFHGDYVEQHTRLLVKALSWVRHQKQTKYLLIGEEKQQAEAWLKIRFKDEQPPCIPTDIHCEFITESIKNAKNLMTQVFLCYADKDRVTMHKIRKSLRRESITVWTNTTDIKTGEAFGKGINRGIEQADNMVYLLSPDSIKSTYCQQELDLAVSQNKRIIPVLVRETDFRQVPRSLRNLHYIDLTENIKAEDYLLDESQLLKILYHDAAYYNEHKILLTKALKWQEQQHNPSILLRGYNLRSAESWLRVALTRRQHPPTRLQQKFITESLRQPPLECLDVFISYSRADSDLARKLNDALQMQGKMTWFDQESIAEGTDFQQEIYEGIKACDNFLFIISPRSVNSPYCADEVEYAASLNKRFVTVLHQKVNPIGLHRELAKVQWLNFNQNERDFNANFNILVRTIDTDREHLRSHTKWLQRALEWEWRDKCDDLLLPESQFSIAQSWLLSTEQENKKPAVTRLQKEFIEASQKAIAAAKSEEKRQQSEMLRLQEERTNKAEELLAEQKKSAQRQKFFLAAVSTLLVAAVGVSIDAVRLRQRAEKVTAEEIKTLGRLSLVLAKSEQKFDALLGGLRAREILKKLGSEPVVKPQREEPVLTALQAAIYGKGFRENNRLIGHQDSVLSVAISPDGQRIASASWDRTVKLWNKEGQLLHTLKGHKHEVYSVAFSPDGQMIASASWDRTVKFWNKEGQLLQTLQHDTQVYSVAFSPDGQMVASASQDNVKLWNLQGQLLQTLSGHQDRVNSVAFSPDGQRIASGSNDRTVKLWNLTGELLQTFWSHRNDVNSVAFSPDGQRIASGSNDRTVKLWNLQGQLLRVISGHEDAVYSVAFSPDGQTIATGSKDNTVELWNQKGELLQTLSGHQDRVNSVAFSPDGQTIVSGSRDNTIELWNLQEKLPNTFWGHKDRVTSVAFSPDGQMVASASWDNTVKLWNQEGELLQTFWGHKDRVTSVAFSPDGQMVASASWDNTVKLWNLQGELLQTRLGHANLVATVAFSPDGQMIASGSRDNTVKLWNKEGQLLRTLSGHEDWVESIAFSPDGQMVAAASWDNTVKLWNPQGELLHTLKHENGIHSIAFSPDGQRIASASRDNTVKLWNLQGELLHILRGHGSDVYSVAFSPDGQMIASASGDDTIKLWNLEGELLQTLQGHEDRVTSVVFSPDGQKIASASSDKTLILWNLADLSLDSLMQHACAWVGDYLKNNAPENDKNLCDGY